MELNIFEKIVLLISIPIGLISLFLIAKEWRKLK